MNLPSPLELINYAAQCLGDLREELVFLGGASVGLLITEPAAPGRLPITGGGIPAL